MPEQVQTIRFGAATAGRFLDASSEIVLLAAGRIALRSGETMITTRDLDADADLSQNNDRDMREALDALLRRGLIAVVQDQGVLGYRLRLTPAGLDYVLPLVIPNFDELVGRIRQVICDLKETTSDEIAHTGISRLVVNHVTLDFKRQGLVKAHRYAEGVMKIDSPSPELCRS
jgi:hypothetical protein